MLISRCAEFFKDYVWCVLFSSTDNWILPWFLLVFHILRLALWTALLKSVVQKLFMWAKLYRFLILIYQCDGVIVQRVDQSNEETSSEHLKVCFQEWNSNINLPTHIWMYLIQLYKYLFRTQKDVYSKQNKKNRK